MHGRDPKIPVHSVEPYRGRNSQAVGLEQLLAALGGEGAFGHWARQIAPGFSHSEALDKVDSGDAALEAWARENGRYLESEVVQSFVKEAKRTSEGFEHSILLFPADGYVIRATKRDMFGLPFRTPGEYLNRWKDFNRLFPAAAVEFLGYTRNSRGIGVIFLRQPYIAGTKPSLEFLRSGFAKKGFQPIVSRGEAFIHEENGIELDDVKPDNVIVDRMGDLVPIDVWVYDPKRILG